jgi:hypothetical protein
MVSIVAPFVKHEKNRIVYFTAVARYPATLIFSA